MGWNGDYVECPNCKNECSMMCRDDNQSDLYLACPSCGLRAYAEKKIWKINNSYIDKSLIGKEMDDLCEDEIDKDRNEHIVGALLEEN